MKLYITEYYLKKTDFGYLPGKQSPDGFLFIYKKTERLLEMIKRSRDLGHTDKLPFIYSYNRLLQTLSQASPSSGPISFSTRKGNKEGPQTFTREETEALLLNTPTFHTAVVLIRFLNFPNGILIWRGLLLLSVIIIIVLTAIGWRTFLF